MSPVQKITISDAAYPKLLKDIPDPPQNLYWLGSLPKNDEIIISIVGTRKATNEGKIIAKEIARDLTQKGVIVASGLALGIDIAAHEGALTVGGRTIAILANGLPEIYPRQHFQISQKIIKNNGCILSEYPPETPAYPNQFLERNRIISGLSIAVIIIEAPIHSGSLVTAKHALDQGREVFIIPGPSRQPNYEGSHLLIRNGARLAANASEILEDLEQTIKNFDLVLPAVDEIKEKDNITDEKELIILQTLKSKKIPLTADQITEETKIELHLINQRLTFLILKGLIIEEGGGKFKLKK